MNDGPRRVLAVMLAHEFPGATELLAQLGSASTPMSDDTFPSIAFDVPSDAPRANVAATVPIEATAPDVDGMNVHFILHVRDGMLAYLDVFREDFGAITRWPTADELDVLTYPLPGPK